MTPVDKKDVMLTVKDWILILLSLISSLIQGIVEKYINTSLETSLIFLTCLVTVLLIVWIFLTNKQLRPIIIVISILIFFLLNYSKLRVVFSHLQIEMMSYASVEGPPCRDNPTESRNIIFQVGNSSCFFSGNLTVGEKQDYDIEIGIDQVLTITTEGEVRVQLSDMNGQEIVSGDASSSLKTPPMVLKFYVVTLSGNGNFKLKAEIP